MKPQTAIGTLTGLILALDLLALALLVGCGGDPGAGHADTAAAEGDAQASSGPGLAVPGSVRDNLGITFERAQRRAVRQTLRVPGQFELLPSARRDYHAILSGRVELHVTQYQAVGPGDLLATLDSPAWRALQSELAEAQGLVLIAQAGVTTAQAVLEEARERVGLLRDRVGRLASAEVRRIELETELAQAELSIPRFESELAAARIAEQGARMRAESKLLIASSYTGLSVDQLLAQTPADASGRGGGPGVARWRVIDRIELRAEGQGVVEGFEVTRGQWVEPGEHLFTTIAPDRLRFRAEALLADLGRLRPGLPAAVVPPTGTGLAGADSGGDSGGGGAGQGVLALGPAAHAEDRAVSLYLTPDTIPGWARAGVAGYLEINLDPGAALQLAVPRRAVVRDGLEFVFFRRLPGDPDRVVRVVADTGRHDGKWVEVFSGVRAGDEVVIDGVYQLLAASSSSIQQGGHFHADGTFHEEGH